MPQLIINLTPKLQERFNYYAANGNETPEELAIRLCAEYVEDCDDTDRIEQDIKSGKIKTYPFEEVRERLALA